MIDVNKVACEMVTTGLVSPDRLEDLLIYLKTITKSKDITKSPNTADSMFYGSLIMKWNVNPGDNTKIVIDYEVNR